MDEVNFIDFRAQQLEDAKYWRDWLIGRSLREKTFEKAVNYLEKQKYDFDGNFTGSTKAHIISLNNSIVDDALLIVRQLAYKQEIGEVKWQKKN